MTSFFQAEKIKEFKKQGVNQSKSIKEYDYQIGKTNKVVDRRRTALPPGKRVSRNGKIYFESRANRSDLAGSKI